MKLNLGCGNDKKEGYINCDISSDVKPDLCFDLNNGIPLKDNSVEEIYMSHVLEHFREPLKTLKEIYRVCRNGAVVKIKVPYFSHESAYSMLDHYHRFTYTSFDALLKGHPCHWQSVGNFFTIRKRLRWRKPLFFFELFNFCPRVYQELFCWAFPAKELEVELEVKK